MMPPITNWKPPGWHRLETLDGYLYRCAQAIDGVAEIQEHFLTDEVPDAAKNAMIAMNELLFRIRDDLITIANQYVSAELEGA